MTQLALPLENPMVEIIASLFSERQIYWMAELKMIKETEQIKAIKLKRKNGNE